LKKSIREILPQAKSIVVITGAGISEESGAPTFKGGKAKWEGYKVKSLLDYRAIKIEPETVWKWYNHIRQELKELEPNIAHKALVELEERIPDFTLVTQNVDGLHTKAGSKNVIEIHGNIWELKCIECDEVLENREIPLSVLPKCPKCGSQLRPNIVWVGEPLPPKKLKAAKQAASRCDFLLIVGTSGWLQTPVSLAMLADKHGAFIVDINIEEKTIFSDIADVALWGKATNIVPSIISLTYKFGS